MRQRPVLLALVFLHGSFASGVIPLLNEVLSERASFAFALYFGGMVIGQVSVWRVGALGRDGRILTLFELGFAAALLAMALGADAPTLLAGRFFEGIFSGLSLPLIFSETTALTGWGTLERRAAWMGSSFAVGFVLGPLGLAGLLPVLGVRGSLASFATLFALAGLAFLLLRQPPDRAPGSREAAPALARGAARWMALFFPLFCAKTAYGFLLSSIGSRGDRYWPEVGVVGLLLALSAIFVCGQAVGTVILRKVEAGRLVRVLPLLLGGAMAAFALTDSVVALLGAAVFHSQLALLGYRNLGSQPQSARQFAAYNALSDPGMLLGALLATLGAAGGWGLAVVGALPLTVGGLLARSGQATRSDG